MLRCVGAAGRGGPVPAWVPGAARLYLAHVERGTGIRQIAREEGCHASTVLRRIRRFESRRDDPLVDEALRALGGGADGSDTGEEARMNIERGGIGPALGEGGGAPVGEAALGEARRVLRRLGEAGAVLAVAAQMEKAVVVRELAGGRTARTATVEREVARALALKDWIACAAPEARVARYEITAAGRSALKRMAAEETLRRGLAEAPAGFAHRRSEPAIPVPEEEVPAPRASHTESPLQALARRRDKAGRRFLSDGLVAAGERLREDFELAQMGPRVTQNWERFLTAGVAGGAPREAGEGPARARARVQAALADLGPGLGDVALRTCCFLEGIETAERRMGWSARSGKIVLRIALQRLRRHYEAQGEAGRMIG